MVEGYLKPTMKNKKGKYLKFDSDVNLVWECVGNRKFVGELKVFVVYPPPWPQSSMFLVKKIDINLKLILSSN